MKNKQHIKRCPFCGGKAGIYEDYHNFYLVQCNRCGVSTLHRADAKTALLEWNRRIDNGISKSRARGLQGKAHVTK